ncbi:MAG: lysylphosphatidylglycerol synthase domain-containing protein [Isosphaeraceae bacterium]
MIKRLTRHQLARLGYLAVAAIAATMMVRTLREAGAPFLTAASSIPAWALATAFGLALVYRVINATGWSLALRILGHPTDVVSTARLWLASEACRWLPGSVWAYGSRTLLATQRGLKAQAVGASLGLELITTVAAWLVVMLIGGRCFWQRLLPNGLEGLNAWAILSLILALAAAAAAAFRLSPRLRRSIASKWGQLASLLRCSFDPRWLAATFLFFVAMAVFNGLALFILVQALPDRDCPLSAVIAANAAAWLAGFFALFAPGGLVVREACLAALLATWLGPELALALALAWRLVQILAEICCFVVVVVWGLPTNIGVVSTPAAA